MKEICMVLTHVHVHALLQTVRPDDDMKLNAVIEALRDYIPEKMIVGCETYSIFELWSAFLTTVLQKPNRPFFVILLEISFALVDPFTQTTVINGFGLISRSETPMRTTEEPVETTEEPAETTEEPVEATQMETMATTQVPMTTTRAPIVPAEASTVFHVNMTVGWGSWRPWRRCYPSSEDDAPECGPKSGQQKRRRRCNIRGQCKGVRYQLRHCMYRKCRGETKAQELDPLVSK